MQELLEYIVKNLVSKPEEVKIEETNESGLVNLELTVDPADMGMIIGKGGQTIHAIRKLLTVRAISENVRVNLHLQEPAGGAPTNTEPEETEEKPQAEVAPAETSEEKVEEENPKE